MQSFPIIEKNVYISSKNYIYEILHSFLGIRCNYPQGSYEQYSSDPRQCRCRVRYAKLISLPMIFTLA